MSQAAVVYAARQEPFIRPGEYRVARAIAESIDEGAEAVVLPLRVIVEATGLSERCVRYTIRRLELRGMLRAVRQECGVTGTALPHQYSFPLLSGPRHRSKRSLLSLRMVSKTLRYQHEHLMHETQTLISQRQVLEKVIVDRLGRTIPSVANDVERYG